jgi:hypothetical protein
MAWLDRLISDVRGEEFFGSRRLIAERTREWYHSVIGFHACRPRSLDAIRSSGVLVSSRERLTREAHEIFGTTAQVEEAIAEVWRYRGRLGWDNHDGGKIWMFLHFDEGRNHCTHYCSHGSELIKRIGEELGREDELTRIGVPAIVECVIPLDHCPDWEAISTEAVSEILRGVARLRPFSRQMLCLRSVSNIPPDGIVRVHELTDAARP